MAVRHLPQFRELVNAASSDVDLWQVLKEIVADCGPDSGFVETSFPNLQLRLVVCRACRTILT